MWCSRSRGRAELTLMSSHTTDVCEDAMAVAASVAVSWARPVAGFRSGGTLVSGAAGPATGPMFAARLGPERRARTLRVLASRTSNPSTPMGTGVLLVSSTSETMWKRPSVPFTGAGRVNTDDAIGEKSSRPAGSAAPPAVTVGNVAHTPMTTSSVTIHRTPTLAPSTNRPYWSCDRRATDRGRFAEGFARDGVLRGMDTTQLPPLSPVDLRARLGLLELERAAAERSPLANDPRYMADLYAEIDAIQAAYVGSVVIEIARLRADLDGRLHG
jgi:hypothetical protein